MIVSNDTIMQKPPYQINRKILDLISEISKSIGKIQGLHLIGSSPKLRKKNRIKTIHGTLSIEGNELGLEKITDIIDGEKVLGDKKEITEVKNAIEIYEKIKSFNYKSSKSLLKAHKIMMSNLIEEAGIFRSCNVGVLAGSKVIHIAPQAKFVPQLIGNLFDYLKSYDEHLLIKSCVFHYEFEFIHPFTDGNGRMGRFWQSLILNSFDEIFEYIPVESIIFNQQQVYYDALRDCDHEGESTLFIEFMLDSILEALNTTINESKPSLVDEDNRIEIAKEKLKGENFSRKEYMLLFKNISGATASRDLKLAVEKNIFKKTGDKRNTSYSVIQN